MLHECGDSFAIIKKGLCGFFQPRAEAFVPQRPAAFSCKLEDAHIISLEVFDANPRFFICVPTYKKLVFSVKEVVVQNGFVAVFCFIR